MPASPLLPAARTLLPSLPASTPGGPTGCVQVLAGRQVFVPATDLLRVPHIVPAAQEGCRQHQQLGAHCVA